MPRLKDVKRVMIIGSGPIVIGQACEFDYSGTQACKALRALGYEIVLVKSNPVRRLKEVPASELQLPVVDLLSIFCAGSSDEQAHPCP